MIIKIEVTQEDIDKGEPEHSCKCPIALSVQRATKNQNFQVHSKGIFDATMHFYKLPTSAQKFIHNFDCGNSVQPFTFEIDITL